MSKKIFIILPHKDQFIKNYAGSASIWVKDFFNRSRFKNILKYLDQPIILKMFLLKKII